MLSLWGGWGEGRGVCTLTIRFGTTSPHGSVTGVERMSIAVDIFFYFSEVSLNYKG